jgi:hypothetical protein
MHTQAAFEYDHEAMAAVIGTSLETAPAQRHEIIKADGTVVVFHSDLTPAQARLVLSQKINRSGFENDLLGMPVSAMRPKMVLWLVKCAQDFADRMNVGKARATIREANAPSFPVVQAIFARMSEGRKGIPIVRFACGDMLFKMKPAKVTSMNYGSIYITTDDGIYCGKLREDGKFLASRDCPDCDMSQALGLFCEDPKAAVIAYARRTGRCAICGRTLTNAESIELGIGPICLANLG